MSTSVISSQGIPGIYPGRKISIHECEVLIAKLESEPYPAKQGKKREFMRMEERCVYYQMFCEYAERQFTTSGKYPSIGDRKAWESVFSETFYGMNPIFKRVINARKKIDSINLPETQRDYFRRDSKRNPFRKHYESELVRINLPKNVSSTRRADKIERYLAAIPEKRKSFRCISGTYLYIEDLPSLSQDHDSLFDTNYDAELKEMRMEAVKSLCKASASENNDQSRNSSGEACVTSFNEALSILHDLDMLSQRRQFIENNAENAEDASFLASAFEFEDYLQAPET